MPFDWGGFLKKEEPLHGEWLWPVHAVPKSVDEMGSSPRVGSLFRVLFRRVPYYIGDPKRDPSLEN